jgi:hypothetical protein
MDEALGLLGLAVYILCVIALAGAVTFGVVRLTPSRRKKPEATS